MYKRELYKSEKTNEVYIKKYTQPYNQSMS